MVLNYYNDLDMRSSAQIKVLCLSVSARGTIAHSLPLESPLLSKAVPVRVDFEWTSSSLSLSTSAQRGFDGPTDGEPIGELDGDFRGRDSGELCGVLIGDFRGPDKGEHDGELIGDFDGPDIGVQVADVIGDFEGADDGELDGEITGALRIRVFAEALGFVFPESLTRSLC